MKRKLWLLAMVGAVVLLSAAPVWADDGFYVVAVGGGVGTKITSLPLEIKNPGFYYLTGNLSYSGNTGGYGITVNADDVTLDLMGFSLNGYLGGDAIHVNADKKNVELRNGTLRGWKTGFFNDQGNYHRVINVRAERNNYGIILNGNSNMVKGCNVSENYYGGISVYGSAMIIGNVLNDNGNQNNNDNSGIYISGFYSTITGNMVSHSKYCIQLLGPGSIIGNTVSCNSGQTGIYLSTNNSVILMDQNSVSGDGTHYAGGSTSVLWAGKSTYYPYGNNAGHP